MHRTNALFARYILCCELYESYSTCILVCREIKKPFTRSEAESPANIIATNLEVPMLILIWPLHHGGAVWLMIIGYNRASAWAWFYGSPLDERY
jgi:hypothetical protein